MIFVAKFRIYQQGENCEAWHVIVQMLILALGWPVPRL